MLYQQQKEKNAILIKGKHFILIKGKHFILIKGKHFILIKGKIRIMIFKGHIDKKKNAISIKRMPY